MSESLLNAVFERTEAGVGYGRPILPVGTPLRASIPVVIPPSTLKAEGVQAISTLTIDEFVTTVAFPALCSSHGSMKSDVKHAPGGAALRRRCHSLAGLPSFRSSQRLMTSPTWYFGPAFDQFSTSLAVNPHALSVTSQDNQSLYSSGTGSHSRGLSCSVVVSSLCQ